MSHKYRVLAVYSFLALLVLAPLLRPGYILTLDMIFAPAIRMPTHVTNDYPWYTLLHTLNFVLPSQIIEKAILLAILVLSGVGMHQLVQYVGHKKSPDHLVYGSFFAGVLYMINPFTYDRFMAGQYNVLLGYAFLPWFAWALLRFLGAPGKRSSVVLGAWAAVIGVVSIHTLGLVGILVLVGLGWTVCGNWGAKGTVKRLDSSLRWNDASGRRDDSAGVWRLVKFSLISVGVFVVASSYWLVPALLGHGKTVSTVGQFGVGDRTAFATVGQGVAGKLWHVAQMQGFWAEARGLYRLPQERLPFWGVVVAVLWVVVGWGIVHAWKADRRREVVLFGGSALVAMVLAATGLNGWLSNWLPFYAGFREPQKFVGLVVLAVALFAGLGLNALLMRWPKQADYMKAGSILLIVLITPTMFWGFAKQLTPRQYPASWFAANKQLNGDNSNFKVLFLPWHQYMYFNFAGRIIANPASNFFDKPTIVSNNPEFGGASGTLTDSVHTRLASNILPRAGHQQHLGAQLASLGIKYVLLSKDSDYEKYGYVSKQTDLRLVSNNSDIQLYLNLAYR